jgi:hypothetical protein
VRLIVLFLPERDSGHNPRSPQADRFDYCWVWPYSDGEVAQLGIVRVGDCQRGLRIIRGTNRFEPGCGFVRLVAWRDGRII